MWVHNFFTPRILHILSMTLLIKLAPPVTQESGWGPKDQDVTLIQELGDVFGFLIGGHICKYMLHEVVLEHQDISDFR